MLRLIALILFLLLITSCSNGNASPRESLNTIKNKQLQFGIKDENRELTYTDFDEINFLLVVKGEDYLLQIGIQQVQAM